MTMNRCELVSGYTKLLTTSLRFVALIDGWGVENSVNNSWRAEWQTVRVGWTDMCQ